MATQTDDQPATELAISLRDVFYEVPRKQVLKGVELDIRRGEIVSIMGQSGSGKTTLLKLMTGLLKPTSGRIEVDGVDIVPLGESRLDDIRMKMGLVFQYAALFDSLNVYDNIVFGVVRHRRLTRREDLDKLVRDLLTQVELEGIENLYPAELSGGMQKRVGLARALAMEPSFVFYDEPTSGLDPPSALMIDTLIRDTQHRNNVTSVVVSHELASMHRVSDRVAMLHEGEIIVFGTPDEVRASKDPVVQAFIDPDRSRVRTVVPNFGP